MNSKYKNNRLQALCYSQINRLIFEELATGQSSEREHRKPCRFEDQGINWQFVTVVLSVSTLHLVDYSVMGKNYSGCKIIYLSELSTAPCHGAWTPAPLSAHPSIECECTAPQIESLFLPDAQQLISSSDDNSRSAALWAHHRWNALWLENTKRLRSFIPDIGKHPLWMAIPRTPWVPLNHLRTSVGRFTPTFTRPILWLVTVEQKNRPSTMFDLPIDSTMFDFPNTSASLWTAWPDGSGWWDNRMAAQHLNRDRMMK